MLDISIIYKIAALGIILLVMDKIFEVAGKKEYATYANIAGIIIILLTLIGVIKQLFDAVKTMFIF